MKKYAKLIITLGLAGGIMLAGCQKNETAEAEPTATPEPTQEAEATPEPTAMAAEEPEPTEDPIPDGYVVSSVLYEAAVITISSMHQDLTRSIRITDSLLTHFRSWSYRK